MKILLIAGVITVIVGIASKGLNDGWFEGTSIMAAVVMIIMFTSVNDYFK